MKIVILGDCSINGNNSIGHLIFNDPHVGISWSLAYHFRTAGRLEYFRGSARDATEWWLKRNKQKNRISINDIIGQAINEYSEFVKKNNIKNISYGQDALAKWYEESSKNTYNLDDALKYVRQKELSAHWSSKLPGAQVYNYAVNGNHYAKYILQLQKHIAQHGIPDLVLIGDHANDHPFVRYMVNGDKKEITNAYNGFLQSTYSETIGYSKEIYDKKKGLLRKEMSMSQRHKDRKMQKYVFLLQKFLERQSINYVHVVYHTYNKPLVDGEFIDMTDIKKKWGSIDNMYAENDHCRSKLSTIDEELKRVNDWITKHKNN